MLGREQTRSSSRSIWRGLEPDMRQVSWSERKPRTASIDDLTRIQPLSLAPEACLEALTQTSYCRSYSGGEEVDLESSLDNPLVIGIIEGRLQLSFRSLDGKEMPVIEL